MLHCRTSFLERAFTYYIVSPSLLFPEAAELSQLERQALGSQGPTDLLPSQQSAGRPGASSGEKNGLSGAEHEKWKESLVEENLGLCPVGTN